MFFCLAEGVSFERTIPTYLKKGEPNLILAPRGKNKLLRFLVQMSNISCAEYIIPTEATRIILLIQAYYIPSKEYSQGL